MLPRMSAPALCIACLVLLTGCPPEPPPPDDDEVAARDRAAVDTSPSVPPAEPDAPDGADPRELSFAPELEVELDRMERRESGLYVEVLEEGEGPRAEPGDSMGVHYTVWFADGRKLDSSHDHQPPRPLGMVLEETALIDGWTEGVTGMREGERRRLVIPYHLAYGAEGRPPQVPPFATLVFEVELARHVPGGE